MHGVPIGRSLLPALLLLVFPVHAQEYSYDGNRWYEVEVSIFTNDYPRGEYAEIAVAEKFNATYLPRVQKLNARTSSLAVDFPDDRREPGFTPDPRIPAPFASDRAADPRVPALLDQELAEAVPPDPPRPLYSPARPENFHVLDVERDPYIDLDAQLAQFTAMDRSIDGSPEHRLLWHKLWRQPMQGRAQAPAIFIEGGNVIGGHSELEGSLRLSDNSGRVMLDIGAWLTRFGAAGTTIAISTQRTPEAPWILPPRPFPVAADDSVGQQAIDTVGAGSGTAVDRPIDEVWQLVLSRELTAGQLYYLDNPALGVLIQIRPYVLPAGSISDAGEDF